MAGLVPGIHDFAVLKRPKTWMPGIKPGMTLWGHRQIDPEKQTVIKFFFSAQEGPFVFVVFRYRCFDKVFCICASNSKYSHPIFATVGLAFAQPKLVLIPDVVSNNRTWNDEVSKALSVFTNVYEAIE
jgi:hypothetical protein